IADPASLTRQWQREMASKFLLPFGRARSGTPLRHEYLFPEERDRPAASLCEPDLTIVSTGLLVRQDRRDELQRAREFDVILLDEAHYARRGNPQRGTRADPNFRDSVPPAGRPTARQSPGAPPRPRDANAARSDRGDRSRVVDAPGRAVPRRPESTD